MSCAPMLNVKTQNPYTKKYELYKPLPIMYEPCECVSMEFMTQLLKWN
jgi:hypothetical protein